MDNSVITGLFATTISTSTTSPPLHHLRHDHHQYYIHPFTIPLTTITSTLMASSPPLCFLPPESPQRLPSPTASPPRLLPPPSLPVFLVPLLHLHHHHHLQLHLLVDWSPNLRLTSFLPSPYIKSLREAKSEPGSSEQRGPHVFLFLRCRESERSGDSQWGWPYHGERCGFWPLQFSQGHVLSQL